MRHDTKVDLRSRRGKRRDFRREMPLLWMRFTLAGRRSNISVGKPIYIPRVCSTRVKAHANNRDWPVRGKYLFWLLIGDTQGLTRRLLKDPLLKDIRGPFPREFAPVLISSYCIYTTLLAIYAPRGMRPRAFRIWMHILQSYASTFQVG